MLTNPVAVPFRQVSVAMVLFAPMAIVQPHRAVTPYRRACARIPMKCVLTSVALTNVFLIRAVRIFQLARVQLAKFVKLVVLPAAQYPRAAVPI